MMDAVPVSGLVGATRTAVSGEHAGVGELLVALKNGRPIGVVEPGKRVYRGLNLPVFGSLQVVPVNAGEIAVSRVSTSVRTRDDFVLPEVRVKAYVRLNPRRGYRALEQLVADVGPTFGQRLFDIVGSSLEAHTRRMILTETHDSLFGMHLTGLLGPGTRGEIGLGAENILLLVGVEDAQAAWDPGYLRFRQQTLDAEVDTRQQRIGAEVQRARLEAFQPLAMQLGLPVEWLADPERRALDQAQLHELKLKLLDPQAQAALRMFPELSRSIGSQLSRDPSFSSPVLGTADSWSDSSAPTSAIVDIQSENASGGRREGDGGVDEIRTPRLNLDASMAVAIDSALGGGNRVSGLSLAKRSDQAAAIVTLAQAEVLSGERALVAQALRNLSDCANTRVYVVRHYELLVLLVRELLGQFLSQSPLSAEVRIAGDFSDPRGRLELILSSESDEAHRLRRLLVSTDQPLMPALEALLPVSGVDVVLGPHRR